MLLVFLLQGCVVGAKLREDATAIDKKIATAMELGARRCAPAELATAQSHLEFLRYEIEEGDYRRATFHREKSLTNVERALDVTDPATCAVNDRDGDGIADPVDQCPDEPEDIDGFEDENGCPDPDNDGDTVLDEADQCPDIAEDRDGNQDEDGCPDVDNDLDTVLDVDDACPIEPGPPENQGCPIRDRDGDGVADDVDQCPDVPGDEANGCPGRVLVVKTDTAIEIKKQIRFTSGKATIRGRISFEILDQVSAVMASNPGIDVRIEGHTDSRGRADYNLQLASGRANSVRDALIERGVEPNRVNAVGFGETKPIASNRTRKGRAANRRVEFNIVQAPADE